MSQAVKCWFHEAEDESDAETVEAHDARWAAEKFAHNRWADTDHDEVFDVMTRDSFGVQRLFEVQVDVDPVFSAREVLRPGGEPGEGGDR